MTYSTIYVIILNWNRPKDTVTCLNSLHSAGILSTNIVVVDNASIDDSVEIIQDKFPNITVIQAECNLGFAGGINLGTRQALSDGADYVLWLNNDTIVDSEMFNQLFRHTTPDVGALAPAIFYADQPEQIWSIGGGINWWLLEATGNHGRNQIIPKEPIERDFLSGCALLVRRDVIEKVGFLDERFFMYYEDLDFCLRVRQAGYRLLLVPRARLWHKVSRSSGGAESPQERFYMALSSGLYFRKHLDVGRVWLIVPYRFLSAMRWTFRLGFHRRWAALKSYWRGLIVGWLGPSRKTL